MRRRSLVLVALIPFLFVAQGVAQVQKPPVESASPTVNAPTTAPAAATPPPALQAAPPPPPSAPTAQEPSPQQPLNEDGTPDIDAPVGMEQPEASARSAPAAVRSERILHAQIYLDRHWFSPGEIDGRDGTNTRRALSAFQQARGLPVTGVVDDATFDALKRGQPEPLVDYTLKPADVNWNFKRIPADMIAKSRLDWLGYSSMEEMLGEKFHVSPALLRELNPGADVRRAGTVIRVPNLLGMTLPPAPDRLRVRKADSSVNLVDAAGRIYARFPATSGSEHDPLPVGQTLRITGIARNPHYNYNPALFWDGNRRHGRATIAPGPNNPVGLVWMALSRPHMGIHGTPEPSRISKGASHGCVRLTNWSALHVAQLVRTGIRVEMVE